MERKVKLLFQRRFWDSVYKELGRRGAGEIESGAFLLGMPGNCEVLEALYYDDLEPGCLDDGGVHLTQVAFIKLADHCEATGQIAKADIHTHPSVITRQSRIDKTNPMIKIPGHMALIVPFLALPASCDLNNLGIHEYLAPGFTWKSYHFKEGILKILS